MSHGAGHMIIICTFYPAIRNYSLILVCVNPHKRWAGVRLVGHHHDVLETDVAGVANIKALGRQVAPHRGLGIFPLLLVLEGLVNLRQVGLGDASLVVDGDVRQRDVLNGMTRQARDAAPNRTGIAHADTAQVQPTHRSDVVDGNEFGNCVIVALAAQRSVTAAQLVAAPTVGQADEDGRLGALDGEVAEADVLHRAAIDYLQRDGRRAYFRRGTECPSA